MSVWVLEEFHSYEDSEVKYRRCFSTKEKAEPVMQQRARAYDGHYLHQVYELQVEE